MPDPSAIPLFRCSKCFALYQVTAQAGPHNDDLQIVCQVCNEPLAARKGQFVLNYFLLRKAAPIDVRRARHGFLPATGRVQRKKPLEPSTTKPTR